MTLLYTAHGSATSGREGKARTDDGRLDIELSPPGSNLTGTNPEQLFACGYAACFGQAVKAVAGKEEKLTGFENVTVNAHVALHKDETKGFYLKVVLDVEHNDADQKILEKIVARAHEICPYSKATKGNIEVTLQANGKDLKKKKKAA